MHNPDPVELRKMMFRQDGITHTAFGSLSYSTTKKDDNPLYFVEDHSIIFDSLSALQDVSLKDSDSITVDGFMSGAPGKGVHVRFVVDIAFPHLAAMAKTMLFQMNQVRWDPVAKADITIFCTPNLECPKLRKEGSRGFTRARGNAITFIDNENGFARIIGSDRFEEVRNCMTLMWAKVIEERGDIAIRGAIRNESVPGEERGLLLLGSDQEKLTLSAFGGERNLICQSELLGFDPNNGPYVADRGVFAKIDGMGSQHKRLYEAMKSQTAIFQDAVVLEDETVDFENTVGGMVTFYLPFDTDPYCEPKRYRDTQYAMILESDSDLCPAASRLTAEQFGAQLYLRGQDIFVLPDNFVNKVDTIFNFVSNGFIETYMLNNDSVAGGLHSMPYEQHQAAIRACVIGAVEWKRSELLGFDVPDGDIVGVDEYLIDPGLSYHEDRRHYEYIARASIYRAERTEALRLYDGSHIDIVYSYGHIETDLDRDDKHDVANEAGLKAFVSNGVSYLTENAMFSYGRCMCDGSRKYWYCPFHSEQGIHGVRK